MNALAALLRPRSVAVVGASADPGKMTGRPVPYLVRHGFPGTIYPVNPRASEIGGIKAWPDIASLPEAPDAAIILLAPDAAIEAVRALSARGTKAAIVLASGFAEGGAEGQARQAALREAAGAMRILGPNTIGLVNLSDRVTLSASGALEAPGMAAGAIGLISQSGGILGSLLSRAIDRGIGFSKLIATGNEADLDSADFIEALVEDDATRVIALYMEGLRRPDAFRRAALAARAKGKPVVVFKVGRSELGAKAAVSHTGALAGEDRVYDAMFRQLGVIRVTTFSDLLDVPAALAANRWAPGRNVAVLTSTGGAATLLADACGTAGFGLPDPDETTSSQLIEKAEVESSAASHNPVDVTLAGLKTDLFRESIRTLLASPSYDAVVVVIGSSALAQPDIVAQAMLDAQSSSDKPLLAYVSPHAPTILQRLNQAGIPAFANPESCSTILEALQAGSMTETVRSARPAATLPDLPDAGGMLDEARSKALFAAFGVNGVPEQACADASGAETAARAMGGMVVLKLLDDRVAHKSELGGVRIGLQADEIAEACTDIDASLSRKGLGKAQGFLVQRLVSDGIEMILGLRRDPQFGQMVLLGMGGVTAELLRDSTIRVLPISRKDARAMVGELRLAPLLTGFRGSEPRDVEALVDAIMAFASMGEALDERIVEAEINPLFVMPQGEGVIAADGLAVLAPA
ncbi:acetate--CoA ligase family protein [Novosphingobium sp. PP1Y]|uniref:acetate--CoA ligase family protein n=1 Tax=Novosphingobium sp. PP1Y TaxID=702113 RepID=UPI00020EF9FD|nr:acetate--CoA ligase [Novosphingobium sp. PP1Y]CCA90691.1 6-carboxyhexanoate-CoA ligase [Novosphingobium sp. PP1Y]